MSTWTVQTVQAVQAVVQAVHTVQAVQAVQAVHKVQAVQAVQDVQMDSTARWRDTLHFTPGRTHSHYLSMLPLQLRTLGIVDRLM